MKVWIDLKKLRENQAGRPKDYVDRILQAGELRGDRVYIEREVYDELRHEFTGTTKTKHLTSNPCC